ncbi:MAG TPA: hypothetical protein VFP72_23035, partial [Kineosporiaceae bacterium]|nr:hypothetical protein [Kineosporiaceae bacterium]
AAAAAGEARARIGRSYAAVDAGLRQLQSEIAAAKEALDQALDARPRPRSGADLSVGEAALQLLDASITAVGRRLAPVTQTQEWQQITQVWKTTRQAWTQVRQLVERDGFRRTAEQLLRTLATRAAEAIAGLAERAASKLGTHAPRAGAARQALTQLSTTARDVAAKVRPLTPAAADLQATNTRVQTEFRHTQAAVDAAFAQILAAFPSTTRQPQPEQAPVVPAPAGDQRRPVEQQQPVGERKSAEPGVEPTTVMRRWAGVVGKIDPSLLDEPGYRRLAAAMERAQSAAEGGADVAALLPRLAARGSWTPGQGADALRVRLTKACPAAATPRPAAVMAGAGASVRGPRQPERPPVPAPPRAAPRRGR